MKTIDERINKMQGLIMLKSMQFDTPPNDKKRLDYFSAWSDCLRSGVAPDGYEKIYIPEVDKYLFAIKGETKEVEEILKAFSI